MYALVVIGVARLLMMRRRAVETMWAAKAVQLMPKTLVSETGQRVLPVDGAVLAEFETACWRALSACGSRVRDVVRLIAGVPLVCVAFLRVCRVVR